MSLTNHVRVRSNSCPDLSETTEIIKNLKRIWKSQKFSEHQEAASVFCVKNDEYDPLAINYGVYPLDLFHKEKWFFGKKLTKLDQINSELLDQDVFVCGYIFDKSDQIKRVSCEGKTFSIFGISGQGKMSCQGKTVSCVLTEVPGLVSPQMVEFSTRLKLGSIVYIEGVVSHPGHHSKGLKQVEIQVRKLYCVRKPILFLSNYSNMIEDVKPIHLLSHMIEDLKPIHLPSHNIEVVETIHLPSHMIEDPVRSLEMEPIWRSNRLVRPNQHANQSIFRIRCQVENILRQFLLSEGFIVIHTPKPIPGYSEESPACLAQVPQLYKQMSICGDFGRVFEIGSVFRTHDSLTQGHLCEFTGVDVEMEIKEHYSEVMDIVDRLFVTMFDSLNETCSKDLETIKKQYPFDNLKYLRKTLLLTFEEGVQMLKEAGVEIDPLGDLNTETEKKLGQLVLKKYGIEFYILHRCPLAVQPFHTMPCHDNPNYSNSFDVFIRGEKIMSGAQRVHVAEFLAERAQSCGVDIKTMSTYIDAFRYGAPPHGGFGVGLEPVVMLFCALDYPNPHFFCDT